MAANTLLEFPFENIFLLEPKKATLSPIRLKIDFVDYQLRIQKLFFETPPTSPKSPVAKKPKRSKSVFGVWKRISQESGTSSYHSSFNDASSLSTESIPLGEIKELRELEPDKNTNVHGKMKELLFGSQFNLKKYVFMVPEPDKGQAENEKGEWETWKEELMEAVKRQVEMSYFERISLWYRKQFDLVTANSRDNHRLKIWKCFLGRCYHHVSTQNLGIEYSKLESLLLEQDPMFCVGYIEQDEFEVGARYFIHCRKSIEVFFQEFNLIFGFGEDVCDNFHLFMERADELKLEEHPSLKLYHDMIRSFLKYMEKHRDGLPVIRNEMDVASEGTKAAIYGLAHRLKEQDSDLWIEDAWLNSYYFLDYLFSEDNTIWDLNKTKVYQDMDRPLSHYWIDSSHNTYLKGDQYSSESSVEPYARALRQGCRCIEIDVWNGPGNKPIVTHGRTLTTSVPLKDVLIVVNKYAFQKSPYPLIISVENHCNLKQQKVMAKYFRKIFGKALVTSPLEGTGEIETLPSPNQLKNRVIIKGGILPQNILHDSGGSLVQKPKPEDFLKQREAIPGPSTTPAPETSEGSMKKFDVADNEGCDCLLTGELWKGNDLGVFIPCFFVLTNKKLFFIQKPDKEENEEDDNKLRRRKRFLSDVSEDFNVNQELHTDQIWYHGDSQGGRTTAEVLLAEFAQTGAFLIRPSVSNPGKFTLSFYGNEKVHHCHINSFTNPNNNQQMFHLKSDPKEDETFPSLYELIEFYKRNPVVTQDQNGKCYLDHLGVPVPTSKSHEDKEWFYKDMDRAGAEAILERLPLNGAFLGRYSSQGEIVISFRYESVIKHCLIQSVGRYLVVANSKFSSLEELKDYYEHHTFYKDIKLSHPVGQDLLWKSQQNQGCPNVYRTPEYINSVVKTRKGRVRAIQSYTTDDPTILSFRKGEKIVNVVKEPDGWWWGIKESDLGKLDVQPKQFCSSFVEDCEEIDVNLGDSVHKGSFDLGCKVKWKSCKDKNVKEYGLKFYLRFKDPDGTKRRLGANCSKRKIKEWVDMINFTYDRDEEAKRKIAKHLMSIKYKIAPEYSDLIIYCCAASKLVPEEIGMDKGNINVTKMKSFDEITGDRLFRSKPSFFLWYHQYALTRIYPKGSRLDSSNLSPMRYWNFGAQLVALNIQKDDKEMQLNRGKFRENGNCGYVLKPDLMFPELQRDSEQQFDPTRLDEEAWTPTQLNVEIISARHLKKFGNSPISPFVEIEVVGVDADRTKLKTCVVYEEARPSPCWNQSISLKIRCPELALLQFSVCHVDTFNDKVFLGECTIPVNCIREGYRSVQLNNSFGEPLLSTLLVKVSRQSSPRPGHWSDGNEYVEWK